MSMPCSEYSIMSACSHHLHVIEVLRIDTLSLHIDATKLFRALLILYEWIAESIAVSFTTK